MVKAPGVVTGRYGTIGEVFFEDHDFWPLNTTLWVSNFHGYDEKFVYYLLQTVDFATHSGKSGVPGVNRNDIHKEIVCVPVVVYEQRAIATALEECDEWIASLERIIAKKQAIRQSLMQQLLTGRSRLLGFSRPWRRSSLGELCLLRSGSPKPRVEGGRYWVIDMGSVTRDADLIVTRKTNDASGLLCQGELVMPKDDIGGGNIIGRTGLIERSNQYVLADHVYALTPRSTSPAFLNFAINSYEVNASLRAQATGSAQLGLSRLSVLSQEVDYPGDVEEQLAIAQVLTEATDEIAGLLQCLCKAQAIKTGMMQQLLTGRTRLPMEAAV